MRDSDFGPPKDGRFEKSSSEPGKTVGTVNATGDSHRVVFDEPEPLGDDEHASPVAYMFSSLVACQLSVLAQCLEKSRVDEYEITADAEIDRRGRDEVAEEMPPHTAKRIEHIHIDIELEVPEEFQERAERCLEVYDKGCIVGQSFRAGIDYTPDTELRVT